MSDREREFRKTLEQIVKDGETIHDGNALFMARLFTDMAKRALDLVGTEQAQSDDKMPEGAAFFKAMVHGAIFKWMEIVQADAPQERLDAQSEMIDLLKRAAKLMEYIEKMEAEAEAGGKK